MALRPTLFTRFRLLNPELLSTLKAPLRQQGSFLAKRPGSRSITTSPTPSPSLQRNLAPNRPFARYTFPKTKNSSSGRRFNSSNAGKEQAQKGKEDGSGSISQRLRKLSREYGWAALGVYLALSAADFPICFAAVRLLGPERIGHYEHVVVQYMKETFKSVWPVKGKEGPEGEEESLPRNLEGASIWTQLALAYAIHKSVFIFVRVPLTAAITPKVVKVLRGWGWNIGKRKPKTP